MRILLSVEPGAPGAEGRVDRAAAYAAQVGGTVDLIHHKGEPSALETLAERIPPGVRGARITDPRDPAEGLVEVSAGYDLLVVGARDHASRVLSHSRCPVLVVRSARPLQRVPRLLVGVDLGSPAPDQVLSWANRWGSALGATLDVVSAVSTHDGDWFGRRDALQAQLDALAARVVDAGRRGAVEVRRGVAEDVLASASADFDLVVVGNRERPGLAQMVLGSVASAVVRRAECDVLCVPTVTAAE